MFSEIFVQYVSCIAHSILIYIYVGALALLFLTNWAMLEPLNCGVSNSYCLHVFLYVKTISFNDSYERRLHIHLTHNMSSYPTEAESYMQKGLVELRLNPNSSSAIKNIFGAWVFLHNFQEPLQEIQDPYSFGRGLRLLLTFNVVESQEDCQDIIGVAYSLLSKAIKKEEMSIRKEIIKTRQINPLLCNKVCPIYLERAKLLLFKEYFSFYVTQITPSEYLNNEESIVRNIQKMLLADLVKSASNINIPTKYLHLLDELKQIMKSNHEENALKEGRILHEKMIKQLDYLWD